MTLILDLKPEVEAGLVELARAQGVAVDTYVQLLLERLSSPAVPKAHSAEEWERALDEWVDGSPEVPHLPDDALTREAIYRQD